MPKKELPPGFNLQNWIDLYNSGVNIEQFDPKITGISVSWMYKLFVQAGVDMRPRYRQPGNKIPSKEEMEALIVQTGGDIKEVARALGIGNPGQIYGWLKGLGIPKSFAKHSRTKANPEKNPRKRKRIKVKIEDPPKVSEGEQMMEGWISARVGNSGREHKNRPSRQTVVDIYSVGCKLRIKG